MRRILISALAAMLWLCAGAALPRQFWLGADISGVTADEARGRFTLNARGDTTETTRLMRDLGLNAIRLRVWVDPTDGFSSPADVLVMARRARDLGMPVMVDFHYSDWWADPGKQNPPAAWKDLSYEQTCRALADHTRSTLEMLRREGVDVRWVQVGNETTHGFLWPMAHLPEHMKEYAGLTKAGYDAVKEVYPEASVIVHLDDGFDQGLYDRVFDGLRENGARWDIIGMSLYPFWAMEGGKRPDAASTLRDCVANIRHVKEKYGTDVMVVEVGVEAARADEGETAWMDAMFDAMISDTEGACLGVWYWEPEVNAGDAYRLGAFSGGRPTSIMDAFTRAAERTRRLGIYGK